MASKSPATAPPATTTSKTHPPPKPLKNYREKIGPDYFAIEHKGYTFAIANTQLWKAPVAGESEKHDTWFKQTLATAKSKNSPVVVVTHYPLFTGQPDEKENYYNIAPEKRRELLTLFEQSGVVAHLAGHTPQTHHQRIQGHPARQRRDHQQELRQPPHGLPPLERHPRRRDEPRVRPPQSTTVTRTSISAPHDKNPTRAMNHIDVKMPDTYHLTK